MVAVPWHCLSSALHRGQPVARCACTSPAASGSSVPKAYRLRLSSSCSWSTALLFWNAQFRFPEGAEAVPEFFHAQSDSGLDGTEGRLKSFGDFHVRQSVVEGKLDRLALHGRQALEGRSDEGVALGGRMHLQGIAVRR